MLYNVTFINLAIIDTTMKYISESDKKSVRLIKQVHDLIYKKTQLSPKSFVNNVLLGSIDLSRLNFVRDKSVLIAASGGRLVVCSLVILSETPLNKE